MPINSARGSLARSSSASGWPERARDVLVLITEDLCRRSGVARVDGVGVDSVPGDRVGNLLGLGVTGYGEAIEHGHDDVGGIDLEMAPQGSSRVAAPEAVGAKDRERAGHPPGDLVGNRLHE